MTTPKFIEIDGKRNLWRDIVKLRQEQRRAAAQTVQPPLFELREDGGGALSPKMSPIFQRKGLYNGEVIET